MTSHGYPDWQRYSVWLGSPLVQQTGFAIGAGAHVDGPFQVSNYASVILAIKPTGGQITATIKQMVQGGPAGLVLSEQFVIPAGATAFEAVVLLGSTVELDLQGSAGGETVDYALYPSNTTTNAQVVTQATINVQHQAALIAAEPTIDFEDAFGLVWVVADDAPNTRVKITPTIALARTSVRMSGAQSIPNNAKTQIVTFSAPDVDSAGYWNAAQSRLDVPAGTYLFHGSITWAGSAAGERDMYIDDAAGGGGNTYAIGQAQVLAAGSFIQACESSPIVVAAPTSFYLYGFQNTGGALNANVFSRVPSFGVTRIA